MCWFLILYSPNSTRHKFQIFSQIMFSPWKNSASNLGIFKKNCQQTVSSVKYWRTQQLRNRYFLFLNYGSTFFFIQESASTVNFQINWSLQVYELENSSDQNFFIWFYIWMTFLMLTLNYSMRFCFAQWITPAGTISLHKLECKFYNFSQISLCNRNMDHTIFSS